MAWARDKMQFQSWVNMFYPVNTVIIWNTIRLRFYFTAYNHKHADINTYVKDKLCLITHKAH
jgi:hypothetical protein